MLTISVRVFILLSLCLDNLVFAADPVLIIQPDHANGIYGLNEKVVWSVDVTGDRAGLTALSYVVKKDDAEAVNKGMLDLSTGPKTITASRGEPGVLLAEISTQVDGKPKVIAGGAVVSPGQITPSVPEPADFDAFWQSKLQELATVPVHPVVEKVDVSASVKYSDGFDYCKVTLDNIRGTHVYGQLSRPTQGNRFPAVLVLQSAGVYPLDKSQVIAHAKPNWLALNISAHDLPIDAPDDFYKNLKEGALKNYIYIGTEDRETCYFLRMFLGCVRAVDYLKSRPDWDGKTLVVTGSSQGGLQSLVTAALCPEVTEVITWAPSGGDVYAPLAHPPRAFGWPYWLSNWGPHDRDMKKVQQTAGYFDADYFAARIHCPTLIGTGLLDVAARPTSVIAAYNAIKAPKDLVVVPNADHFGSHGTQAEFLKRSQAWETAIQNNQPLPIPFASKETPSPK